MVRDIIDLVNKNDDQAALLFLDQEKAFDRVNHSVLYKIMEAFGFGETFINWIRLIYSNATTRLIINGFLSDKIPLHSGVRQGCPLSALLYVMVIELLALQLRANPNIIGFTVQGEKIISSHYSDDAVIKITQNRCFKEVYKDLHLYEEGTGAKINYDKTQGLWLGRWKSRTDDPFEDLYTMPHQKIKWTNKNVKYLGIFVGNDRPDFYTFEDIIPKMSKRLHYWKPLSLPILSKSRIIEIFHASKLWYAGSFYPIPEAQLKLIEDAFLDYITFPKKKVEVSKMEMEKERKDGGIKLINVKLKSWTPKIFWLINLLTDPSLKYHRKVFNSLVGTQKGGLKPEDCVFTDQSYVTHCLQSSSLFYKEAFSGISKLNTWKHIEELRDEHVFFNPIFTVPVDDLEVVEEKTIKPFTGNSILSAITTYGDLVDAANSLQQQNLRAAAKRKLDSIVCIRQNVDFHEIMGRDNEPVPFKQITQRFIYSELVYAKSVDHSFEGKWAIEHTDLPLISWKEVWETVHKNFFTEKTKSTIWELIHLNFYTTHNYNSWHNELFPCPLCNQIPQNVFHIIFDCKFVTDMWKRIEPFLLKVLPLPLCKYEQAFGLHPRSKSELNATILRNWTTFSLRTLIMQEERRAFYIGKYTQLHKDRFIQKFNTSMQAELHDKHVQYIFRGLENKFDAIISANDYIKKDENGEYTWPPV